nr:40S ribosomal protein S3-3 [Ipomoea batatas]
MYAEHLIRAQHAKSMKFKDAYMISSGQLVKEYIASGLGVLDIKVKVKIMLDWDPKGMHGLTTPLPAGIVIIRSPKEEEEEEYMRAPIPPITNIELLQCRILQKRGMVVFWSTLIGIFCFVKTHLTLAYFMQWNVSLPSKSMNYVTIQTAGNYASMR